MKKSAVPTTDLARRIAAIAHRKPITPWSDKELRLYKKLYRDGAFNETDLALVERYQAFHRCQLKKGRAAFHRRGLYTILFNWGDEVDRSTEHDELHPLRPPPRKIIPLPPMAEKPPEPLSPEDEERADNFWEELRLRNPGNPLYQRPRSAFQEVKAVMDGKV